MGATLSGSSRIDNRGRVAVEARGFTGPAGSSLRQAEALSKMSDQDTLKETCSFAARAPRASR